MITIQSPEVRQGENAATSTPRPINFYLSHVTSSPLDVEMATREVEDEPELYRNVLQRMRTAGELVPADEALAESKERP